MKHWLFSKTIMLIPIAGILFCSMSLHDDGFGFVNVLGFSCSILLLSLTWFVRGSAFVIESKEEMAWALEREKIEDEGTGELVQENQSISIEYANIEVGQRIEGVFMGFRDATLPDMSKRDLVTWSDKNKLFCNSSETLVHLFRRYNAKIGSRFELIKLKPKESSSYLEAEAMYQWHFKLL